MPYPLYPIDNGLIRLGDLIFILGIPYIIHSNVQYLNTLLTERIQTVHISANIHIVLPLLILRNQLRCAGGASGAS